MKTKKMSNFPAALVQFSVWPHGCSSDFNAPMLQPGWEYASCCATLQRQSWNGLVYSLSFMAVPCYAESNQSQGSNLCSARKRLEQKYVSVTETLNGMVQNGVRTVVWERKTVWRVACWVTLKCQEKDLGFLSDRSQSAPGWQQQQQQK